MNIKVSKVFAKFINNTAKEMGFKCEAEVVTLSENQMRMFMGTEGMFDADDYGDYDWEQCKYKAIRVVYPDDYYACPLFIGTGMLLREWRRIGGKTEQDLKDMLREMIEI